MKMFSHQRTAFLNVKYFPYQTMLCRLYCHQEGEIPQNTKWKPAVGLEIHAQIASESKLFSMAPTDFSRPVNSGIAPFDCAIPGTLPMLNRRCVEAGILTSLALGCQINQTSIFERKHYFYSDLPAGFQITQQRKPLAVNGRIEFCVRTPGAELYKKSSKIKQIQLEQDSGKSLHCEVTQRSLIDLNRAGAPLMELVFEPDLNNGEEAASLVKELLLILELLGTCSCKMEEGALRVDANVSVSQDSNNLGTRTELKNIGSIKSVAAAIKYEIKRHISIIEQGGTIVNETRAWDADKHRTVVMREKEEKQDYRFMPENNLPFLRLHVDESKENTNNLVDVVSLSKNLPVLPKELRNHLQNKLNLPLQKVMIISADIVTLRLFYFIIEENPNRNPNLVYNFLMNHVFPILKKHQLKITIYKNRERFLGQIVDLLESQTINLSIAQEILDLQITDKEIIPQQVVEDNNWFQIVDEKELEKVCLNVIQENEKIVKKYKAGKKKVLKALLGQIVQKTNKCANMGAVVEIMERLLDSDT